MSKTIDEEVKTIISGHGSETECSRIISQSLHQESASHVVKFSHIVRVREVERYISKSLSDGDSLVAEAVDNHIIAGNGESGIFKEDRYEELKEEASIVSNVVTSHHAVNNVVIDGFTAEFSSDDSTSIAGDDEENEFFDSRDQFIEDDGQEELENDFSYNDEIDDGMYSDSDSDVNIEHELENETSSNSEEHEKTWSHNTRDEAIISPIVSDLIDEDTSYVMQDLLFSPMITYAERLCVIEASIVVYRDNTGNYDFSFSKEIENKEEITPYIYSELNKQQENGIDLLGDKSYQEYILEFKI